MKKTFSAVKGFQIYTQRTHKIIQRSVNCRIGDICIDIFGCQQSKKSKGWKDVAEKPIIPDMCSPKLIGASISH